LIGRGNQADCRSRRAVDFVEAIALARRIRFVRVWLALATLAVLLSVRDVSATQVVGRYAELVGVAGPELQTALVVERDAQEEDTYLFYQVDMSADVFRRVRPRTLTTNVPHPGPSNLDLWGEYLGLLTSAEKQRLSERLVFAEQLVRLTPNEATSTTIPFQGAGVVGSATLELSWTTASADAYDRLDPDGFDPCVNIGEKKVNCSACAPTLRWVNGERITSYECFSGGSKLPPEFRTGPVKGVARVACACDARANMFQLVLRAGANIGRGARALVEPFRTFQGGGGTPSDVTAVVAESPSTPLLRVYLTPERSVIAVGSAAHQPHANATHFPLFAAVELTN
jgi:hypothetical protein